MRKIKSFAGVHFWRSQEWLEALPRFIRRKQTPAAASRAADAVRPALHLGYDVARIEDEETMKFNMSDRSLFAILLRSPWWISFAIVAVVALVFKLALPEASIVFGILSGLPFIVIGSIAAWRQLRAPSPSVVNDTLQAAQEMSWREFAGALERSWRAAGYQVTRLDSVGADFMLEKEGRITVAGCKRWKAGTHGIEPLRQLDQTAQQREAAHSLYLALGDINDNARRFAADKRIRIVQGAELAQLLRGASR